MKNPIIKIQSLINEHKQFIKYAIVGASGTFIDLASLYVFVEYAKIAIIPAAILSFLLAVINNFLLNKSWTFRSKSRNYRKLFIKFLIISLIGLGLTVSFMYLFTDVLEIWYMLSKALTSLVVLTWNFLGNKLWTFRLNSTIKISDNYKYDLSVIVPAYNESNRIKPTLLSIAHFLDEEKINAEIIVVSDGSSDDTNEVVNKLCKKIPSLKLEAYKLNQGKGHAVKVGIDAAEGKLILFTDADNSTPIEEYTKLKKALEKNKADIAIGSRYLPKSDVQIKQPFYRIVFSRAGNFLISLFLIDDIKDTQCGFKLFRNHVAKEIFHFQKVKRFGFDMEALVVANNLEHKIVEVPVSWFNSAESRVRPVKDGLRTLRDLVYIKLNLWSGRYSND